MANSAPRSSSTPTDDMSGGATVVSNRTTLTPRAASSRAELRVSSVGVRRIPRTPWPEKVWRRRASLSGSACVEERTMMQPSSDNRASVTTLRRACAYAFRTYPSSLMACSTRLRACALTRSGLLNTLETVPTETPAARATSLTLGRALSRP